MTNKRVLLGFSGGLDSTAAALLLQEAGYRVTLLTLDTTGNNTLLEEASSAAHALGLPWRSMEVRSLFYTEVVQYFVDGYRMGETPAPCTRCNTLIKWSTLYRTAIDEGFDHIATGHYFRIAACGGRLFVQRGVDPSKDQSYYLWQLPQEYLQMALTPMGDHYKCSIRERFGELVAQRESMGVCFLAGDDYRHFLRQKIHIVPGELFDWRGERLGSHSGYTDYTVGQRRGVESLPTGWAVTRIDPAQNRVEVGPDHLLRHRHIWLREWQATDPSRFFKATDLHLHIRGIGRNPQQAATVTDQGERIRVDLQDDAWAPALGQPAVFYQKDRVVGGGIVDAYRN